MAKVEIEAAFLSAWLRDAQAGKDTALRIMTHIRGEMLEYQQIADAYDYLTDRYAKGKPLNDLECETQLAQTLGDVWFKTVQEESRKGGKVGEYTKAILFNYRARKQAAVLAQLADNAAKLIGLQDEKASIIADSAISKLATLHTTTGDLNRPVTRDEITKRARDRLTKRGKSEGILPPYSKLGEHTGNFLPGDLIAVAGYSNSGKSLLAANFWRLWAVAGIPQIAFSTEMGLAWHARGVAAHTNTPQMIAEREQWELATQAQIDDYDFGLQELGKCPWELVDKPSITVDEIISRASVLRRRWDGKPVVVIVDHMHRLRYRGEADKEVGQASKELRNWARQDESGGIILCLLYQPRKPADEMELYRPVRGDQIRGVSEVWNEIDFLFSPYRRWVKTDPNGKTPWDTPSTLYDPSGFPVVAVPNAAGAKLDDEHVYVSVGKRRVGGAGPTVMLHSEAPSGRIYEISRPKLAVIGGRA